MGCSVIMLGIGLYMFLMDVDSTSVVTGRYHNPSEHTISWQTPIFGAIVLLILGIMIKTDKPSLPKMDIWEKRSFIFDKIAVFFREREFKKTRQSFLQT